jgi:transporter family protein
MNNAVLLGGVVLLLMWGVWGIAAKMAIKEVGLQVLVWSQVAALALFPLYFLLFKELLPIKLSGPGIGWALVAGALGVLGTLILYLLLRAAPTSIVIPLSALYPVVTVVLAYFFLHEEMPPTRILGVVCALAAIWLLTT